MCQKEIAHKDSSLHREDAVRTVRSRSEVVWKKGCRGITRRYCSVLWGFVCLFFCVHM